MSFLFGDVVNKLLCRRLIHELHLATNQAAPPRPARVLVFPFAFLFGFQPFVSPGHKTPSFSVWLFPFMWF